MRVGLLILMGLPGSGKTTLAKILMNNFQRFDENVYQFIHVCYDDLIPYENHVGGFGWKSARQSVAGLVEKLVVAIKEKDCELCPVEFIPQWGAIDSWDSNIVLILDDNMYFKSMRYSFFQIAKKHMLGFCQAYLCCSLENALSSNSLRKPGSMVPPHVIEKMNDKMELPDCGNNWEKYSIKLNAFCTLSEIYGKLFPVLNESLDNFMQEKDDDEEKRELSKVQCKKSILHQADIAIRKIISVKIKKHIDENGKEKSKEYINSLNLRKCEILSDVRNGNIHLPEELLEEINEDVTENYQLMNLLGSYL